MWHFLFLLLLVPESLLAATEKRQLRPRIPSNHKEEYSGVARRGTRRSPMKFGANRGPITFGPSEDGTQQIIQPNYELVGNGVQQITYSDNYIPERYPGDDRVYPYQQFVLPDPAQSGYQGVRAGARPAATSQEPPPRFQAVRQPAPITQVVEGDGNGLGANGVGLGLNANLKKVPLIGGTVINRTPGVNQSPGDANRQAGLLNGRFTSLQALLPNVPKEIRVGSGINADVSDGRPRKDLFTAATSRQNRGNVASPGQQALAAAVQSQGQQTASSSQYQYETAEEVDDGGSQQQQLQQQQLQQQQQQQQQGGYAQEGYGGNQDGGQGSQRVGLGLIDPTQGAIGNPNEVGSFSQSSQGQLGIGNSGISGLYGAGYEEFLKKHGSSGVLESLGIGHRTNPLFAALLLNNIIISNQKGKPPIALNYGEANQHYLGLMLKQYGKYLPYGLGSYGLYGYSASNNLHNSKAFGQYKHEQTV